MKYDVLSKDSPVSAADLYRLFIENIKDYAIFMLDPGGYITTWNIGAERINGYKANEIIGKHFSIFYTPEAIKKDHPGYELKTARQQGRYEEEGYRVKKDGSLIWMNIIITAIFDDNQNLLGYGKITRDLTEHKAQESQIDTQRKLIRELSTPVLQIQKYLLLLPIIGIIDEDRALQLKTQLLNTIRTFRAKVVVIDLTGISSIDFEVANHFMEIVSASRLMGATLIFTGFSIKLAEIFVNLGFDLSKLITAGNLQSGIEQANAFL
jgi:PAS domain S-box-containing protein